MDKKTEMLFSEYLQSSGEQKQEIRQKLAALGVNVEELEQIYQDLDQLHTPSPGPEMTENFYRMLNNEKRILRQKSSGLEELIARIKGVLRKPVVIRTAYSLILLVVGWLTGFYTQADRDQADTHLQYMSAEIRQMKKMVAFSMLNQSSPTERIKALHYLHNNSLFDDQTTGQLFEILNEDPNVNVRLVALETLLEYSDLPGVRTGLLNSINQQQSPIIQITLVKSMVQLKDEQAVHYLKKLLRDEELNYIVREQVERSLKLLI